MSPYNNKQCKIKYEIMTCNRMAISKVMGCGIILNMIRDKNKTQEMGEGWWHAGQTKNTRHFDGLMW
jgi:hypothetical protein